MLRETVRSVVAWLRRALTQPFEELNRWQLAARFAYDLGRFGARQLKEDRAPQMAAALAFRTLFSLAPVMVVTTILVKAFRGTDAILSSFRELLIAAGLDKVYIANVTEASSEVGSGTSLTLANWLEELTSQLINMNLTAIGGVGLAVIVYAAIGLMVTIENSFNTIYRAPEGRLWVSRVPLYWFILTLSPALVFLASYVHHEFTDWISSVDTWQWLLFLVRTLWSFGLAWLFMLTVYALLPNCHVKIRPAIVGAFVATLLLAIGRQTLGAYLGNAFAINQLYGALGLVPLFMFWVYLMWLAVLFGLQVSATLQSLRGRTLKEINPPQVRAGIVDATAVLAIMEVIAEQFSKGRPMTSQKIAEITSLPEVVVSRIVERLVHDGWLHRVEHPETAVSLAQPPDKMSAEDFIRVGFQLADEGGPGRPSAMLTRLREAQQRAVDGVSLAALVGAEE